MKVMFSVVAMLIFSGCTMTHMYDGEKLTESQAAIFYTNSHSSGPYMTFTIDEKKFSPSLLSPKSAFLKPGEHDVALSVFISRGMLGASRSEVPDDFRLIRQYEFKLPLEAGYAYQIEHPGFALRDQKFELCLYGEPHDASGSRVSWGYELREMSENAKKVSCQTPALIVSQDGRKENPDAMPDFMPVE